MGSGFDCKPWHTNHRRSGCLADERLVACGPALYFLRSVRGQRFGDEFVLGRVAAERFDLQQFSHITPWLFLLGDAKIVPFLQDRAELRHAAEVARAGCLAGKPAAVSFFVLQIELGVAVPGSHTVRAGIPLTRHMAMNSELSSSQSPFPSRSAASAPWCSVLILDVFTNPVVDCLHFFPGVLLAFGRFLGAGTNLRVAGFDEGTRTEIPANVT